MEQPISERLLGVTELASVLGLTAKAIDRLAADGIFFPVLEDWKGRKVRKYPLGKTVKAYLAYREDYVKKQNSGGDAAIEELVALKTQKLRADIRWKDAQGELQEIKTAISKGDYIPVQEIEAEYVTFFVALKTFLLGIPSRVAGNISGDVSPERARILEHELGEDIKAQMRAFILAQGTPPESPAEKPSAKIKPAKKPSAKRRTSKKGDAS